MPTAFLSYSTKDHHFAELALTKLAGEGIDVWQDRTRIRPGEEWRREIDEGLGNCDVILIALSENSVASPYVTYEWSYGLGKGLDIVPLKLEECEIHPRLRVVQYLDFSTPGAYPWSALVETINAIEVDAERVDLGDDRIERSTDEEDVRSILMYLDQRGYQRASYERIQKRVDENLSDERLDEIVERNSTIFRPSPIKGGKRGLAKVLP